MQYLKCDEASCDHVENHEKLTEDMVNKECPKCHSNLRSYVSSAPKIWCDV